ncbi:MULTISPECIES: hypothetical protein [Psychrobacter]|uniref:Uncharacterized protein n=1 Tax=Psychrobacter immobilis TaxID=498 RepID=A0A2V1ZS92_PSYIM|nr:hypothetical protein [Psychrobacter immobilis]PWK07838.1 hypothetical protein C8D84_11478 [Psychrobacter immobilis]
MNIKSSVCLIAISSILYGCSTAPTYSVPPQSAPTIPPDKVVGDGSHLLGLPMTRDFITNPSAYTSEANTNYQKAVVKVSEEINAGQKTTSNLPDKKIFSIKPVGDVKPRAVILLKKGKIMDPTQWTVRKKNITVCESFMTLPIATPGGSPGSQQVRDNEVITFMPVNSIDKTSIPLSPKNCEKFISDKNGYDYVSASQELAFILDGKDVGRSPFLAIYESPKSPYSSMVLSLGELSPGALRVLTQSWPELIAKVYQHGNNIDPVAGIATMLLFDSKLKQAQSDAKWGYMKIGVTGAMCGGAFTASTITLNTLIATPACSKFILDAADAFGYTIPENMSKILRS